VLRPIISKLDSRAQMDVMEVMLTAVLFTSVMNVAIDVLPSAHQESSGNLQLELLGRDVLTVADELVPENGTIAVRYSDSTLKWWLFGNGLVNLSTYLNTTLTPSIAYRLDMGPVGEEPTVLLGYSILLGDVTVIQRLLSFEGQVYEVKLLLWYGYRGTNT